MPQHIYVDTPQRMTSKSTDIQDFRLYLQKELIKRCATNPKYSVRAFAKYLGIENSALSKILGKKRKLTAYTIHKLGERLSLGPLEMQKFVSFHASYDSQNIFKPRKSNAHSIQVAMDTFAAISDWYHFAIVELARIKSFKVDSRYIASLLGISQAEAIVAIDRLERLKFIKIEKNCLIANIEEYDAFIGRVSSPELRKMQTQILSQAIDALENVALEDRSQTSVTMAVDKNKIEEAKKIIRNFEDQMIQTLMGKKTNLISVYQLSVSLFPALRKDICQ